MKEHPGPRQYIIRKRADRDAYRDRRYDLRSVWCDICHSTTREVVLDADPQTELIRGLLCRGCKSGLKGFQDSKSLIEAATAYLRRTVYEEPPKELLGVSPYNSRESKNIMKI